MLNYAIMNKNITILLAFSLVLMTSCLPDKAGQGAQAQAQPKPATAAPAQRPNPDKAPQINIKSDKTGSLRTNQPTAKAVEVPQKVQQMRQNNRQHESAPTAEQIAAKQRAKANPQKPKAQPAPPKTIDVGPKLPDPCALVSEAFIGKLIGVDPLYIGKKDGSGKSFTQRSCFFRWEHDGIANSGVLIQVQKNPIPDEFPDWAAYYISAKKNEGDKAPDGSSTYRYKDFPGYGVAGAYSSDMGRYYWRLKNDVVFMVALNMPEAKGVQLEWAKAIATEVSRNAKF